MEESDRSPARVLAPIALVVFAICALVIVTTAGGGGKSSSSSSATKDERRALKLGHRKRSGGRARTTTAAPPTHASTYVVKAGDTLGGIADKTGISVERLQQLNPSLDPQALQSGQRVKLR